jgi:hypothetical protein
VEDARVKMPRSMYINIIYGHMARHEGERSGGSSSGLDEAISDRIGTTRACMDTKR